MYESIYSFAQNISAIVGRSVSVEHIHCSTYPDRYSPLLLQHYRGPIVMFIHPDDYHGIISGKSSVDKYVSSATWQIGYYWVDSDMNYFQPFDIVDHKDEVQRYFRILNCRTSFYVSGYIPSEGTCMKCSIENCPMSVFKGIPANLMDNEVSEFDPRFEFNLSLRERFKEDFPGSYFINDRLLSSNTVPEDEVWLIPTAYDQEFFAVISRKLEKALLMHIIEPDFSKFVLKFKFLIWNDLKGVTYEVTDSNLKMAHSEEFYQ